MIEDRQRDGGLDPEWDAASPYDALADDPKILAVIDTVRRVSGLPTGRTMTTFAPARAGERQPGAASLPEQDLQTASRRGPARPAPSPPTPPAKREAPVAASLGPAGRRFGVPGRAIGPTAPPEPQSGPPRGLLFGAIAALLLHLAVFIAIGGSEPIVKADAHSVGTIIGALIERVGLPT